MAKEAKHTPGPWSLQRSKAPVDGEYDYAINAEGVRVLAEVFGRASDGGYPPDEANAHLIAAAPELLEALAEAREGCKLLESLTACRGDDDYVWGLLERIDAALAKAEGRS